MTSALLKHGIDVLRVVRANLTAWMEAHEYTSIRQMQGSMSYRSVADPAAFERANYMRVLSSDVCGADAPAASSQAPPSRAVRPLAHTRVGRTRRGCRGIHVAHCPGQ